MRFGWGVVAVLSVGCAARQPTAPVAPAASAASAAPFDPRGVLSDEEWCGTSELEHRFRDPMAIDIFVPVVVLVDCMRPDGSARADCTQSLVEVKLSEPVRRFEVEAARLLDADSLQPLAPVAASGPLLRDRASDAWRPRHAQDEMFVAEFRFTLDEVGAALEAGFDCARPLVVELDVVQETRWTVRRTIRSPAVQVRGCTPARR